MNYIQEYLLKLSATIPEQEDMLLKLAADEDTKIVAATLIGEAAGEGIEGMQAVYNVIVNRSKHKNSRLKNICLEPAQFSFWNGKTTSLQDVISKFESSTLWPDVLKLVYARSPDNTFGSTHYFSGSAPTWGNSKTNPCWIGRVKIGNHTFGINMAVNWLNYSLLPEDIIELYGGTSNIGRCYIDKPKRYPPKKK